MNNKNIVAIATANGYAGIGIVRISGHNLTNLIGGLINSKDADDTLKPNLAKFAKFYDSNGEVIDSGLLLYFKAPHSFTGEDVLELQAHGSPVLLRALVNRALELGCTLAGPGEFSKRAYENGKIDLLQAESIMDLIHASSEEAARSANRSLQGEFSKQINGISQKLIYLRTFIESSIDFVDDDVQALEQEKVKEHLGQIQSDIYKLLSSTKQGVLLNNGINLVIIGQTNVGKSTLLNTLANEEIAIVSDIHGTTRDIVKETININGVVFNIIDTAGIRTTQDNIEQIGIERAFSTSQKADMCLVVIDATIGLSEPDEDLIAKLPANLKKIIIFNKMDLIDESERSHLHEKLPEALKSSPHLAISARAKLGINELRELILQSIGFNSNENNTFIARTRHLQAMQLCAKHIDQAFTHWQILEIVAEEIRLSHEALGSIIGEFTNDDLLGEIFGTFCIGK